MHIALFVWVLVQSAPVPADSLETHSLLKRLPGFTRAIQGLSFSPDGKLLACGSEDGSIKLIDPDTQTVSRRIEAGGIIQALRFSPDGKLLAASANPKGIGQIQVWAVPSGKLLANLSLKNNKCFGGNIAFSKDSKLLAVGEYVDLSSSSATSVIKVWNTENWTPVRQLECPAGHVEAVQFSPTENYLASGHSDGMIRLWNPQSGAILREFPSNAKLGNVTSLSFDGQGKVLASAYGDGFVAVWNPANGERLALMPNKSRILSVAFSADGNYIACGSTGINCGEKGAELILWHWRNPAKTERVGGFPTWVYRVEFRASDDLLACSSFDEVWLWKKQD